MGYNMTKQEFLDLRNTGLTFKQIGEIYNLTERQVNYRTKGWGLDYSKKKGLNEHFFSSNTKAAFYWAGFLAADGWIEACRNRVGLALQKQDYEHLEKFKRATNSEHSICPFMNNSAYRIRFNSVIMVEELKTLFNIVPAKTHIYEMPIFEDDYLMLEFLRGYIEGDGHLEKKASGRVSLHLCSANKKFLEEFIDICEYLLGTNIYQVPRLSINPKGQVYTIVLTLDHSEQMIRLLYKNSTTATRLDRKYKVAQLVML